MRGRRTAHARRTGPLGRDEGSCPLTPVQRAAVGGVPGDGAAYSRTVPGLGSCRVTALDGSGIRVLAGLPVDGVRRTLGGPVRIEAAVMTRPAACYGSACSAQITLP
ncbi:hypothetical protein ABT167_22135 [Streptomyces sp. NPDC001792]|uniref:hypothetical protein n=1 Tax=Streptomyces sp. NPDC001792 TaxID=3154524 RepID=UPI00331C0E4D